MSRNYERDEVLVYIRRVDPTQKRTIGPRGQWDYHLMTSLPTNDNPRYSRGDNNPHQDILSDYYFKIQLGPSDFKILNGFYPQESGIDATGGLFYYSPIMTAQIEVPTTGSKSLYYWQNFPTQTGESSIYIDFRNYKIIENNQIQLSDVYPPYESMDFIRTTGVPKISFRKNINNLTIDSDFKFKALPEVQITASGTPSVTDQTGILKFTSAYSDETVSKQYKLTYNEDYVFVEMRSQELDYIGGISVTPSLEYVSTGHPNVPGYNPYPNKPVVAERGIIKSPNGIYPPWGITDIKLEQRRRADTALNKIPLLEICNKLENVGCAATHVAYKIGDVYPSVNEYITTSGTIAYTDAPAVYMFINSTHKHAGSFYSRLPECWPWSCRRWTAETGSYNGNPIVKYYKQDASGVKVQVSESDIPKVNISFSTFTGHEKSINPKVLNTDPLALIEVSSPNGKLDTSYASDPDDLFTGYHKSSISLPIDDLTDEQKVQCGCGVNHEKIEFATEIFPLLHDATCKLIMKAGYLCYPTKDCINPVLGVAAKKIIYPFNSCRFNETLEIDLEKLNFPMYEINTDTLDFYPTEGVNLYYVFSTGNKPIYTDPEFASGHQTVSLDDGYSISIKNKTGYLSTIAKYPCKYTTDIHIYQLSSEGTTIQNPYPYNTVYNCPTSYLGKMTIKGNGTDYPEEEPITGGDYYIESGVRKFWNKCDKPRAYEYYEAQSLGNAGSFINAQANCCEYCKELPQGSLLPEFFPNPSCSELDVEGTSNGVPHYSRAGSCKVDRVSPCDDNAVIGKATLRVITTTSLETPAMAPDMEVTTDFIGSGVIIIAGNAFPMSGIANASGVRSSITMLGSGNRMDATSSIEEMIPPIENNWGGATGATGSGGGNSGERKEE